MSAPTVATTYKENLLTNARYMMHRFGGKVIVRGKGNDRKVTLVSHDGLATVVWYPTESRVNDLEIADLKEAIKWKTGHEAFSKFDEAPR